MASTRWWRLLARDSVSRHRLHHAKRRAIISRGRKDADFCILDPCWLLVIVGIFSNGMLVIDAFRIWPLMRQWF
jgi:hypothetical protein